MSLRTNIEFEQLRYSVKHEFLSRKKKLILNNVNGEFRSCELSAVIGQSGSGKTSLLNVLSGYVTKNVFGTIRINGEDRSDDSFKKLSTYIMQEENLHPLLTVYEAMSFAMKFKTGNFYNQKERHSKIISILETLGLDVKINAYSGSLSGGEQKRLSIAVELVDDPSILFLDEPTTGLDSSSSTQCIRLLKRLAQEGKTIICTIHTPSALILRMFDQLYAMADGCCIYQGSSENLVPFLNDLGLVCPELYNPSDFLLEVSTNEYGPQNDRLVKKIKNGLNEQYRESLNNNHNQSIGRSQKDDKVFSDNKSSHFVREFTQLMHRNYVFLTRDKLLLLIRLVAHVAVGLMIGFLYFDIGNSASQIFNIYRFTAIGVGFLSYSGFYSLMVRYPLDLPITKREYFNRWYSSSSYYLALIVSDIPVTIICCAIYTVIIYILTNQPLESFRFLNFVLICVLTSFAAQAHGLMIGSMFDLKLSLIAAALLMAAHILFGGIFIISKDIPSFFTWIFQSIYLKYSLEGVGTLIFGYNRKKLDCNEIYCHFQSPQKFMDILGLEENLPRVYLAITITLFVVHLITFCIMCYRLKN